MSKIPCGGCGRVRPGEPWVSGRDCRFCWLAANNPAYAHWRTDGTAPPAREKKSCGDCGKEVAAAFKYAYTQYVTGARPSGKGVGTELKDIIKTLGFPLCAVKCKELMQAMDEWGPAGCHLSRDTILAQLRETQARLKWTEKVKAGVNAVRSGLAFKLDPLDPAPGLLDEAIRRTLRKEREARHGQGT